MCDIAQSFELLLKKRVPMLPKCTGTTADADRNEGDWQAQRQVLRESLAAVQARLDCSLLANHLLFPSTVPLESSLVTPKANALAQLLLGYEVRSAQ